MSSTFTFTYYPDPEIEDVKPTEQLARCVSNSNLNLFKSIQIKQIVQ